jgi:hypothetical protein
VPSERIQRRIDALLDEADTAVTSGEWPTVAEKAAAVLGIDPANEDAQAFLQMARSASAESSWATIPPAVEAISPATPAPTLPASFAGGRYGVRRFLGEGGRKRVYLTHDSRLPRVKRITHP